MEDPAWPSPDAGKTEWTRCRLIMVNRIPRVLRIGIETDVQLRQAAQASVLSPLQFAIE
jgi:hypothetical protein